jgi:hypothetical protein
MGHGAIHQNISSTYKLDLPINYYMCMYCRIYTSKDLRVVDVEAVSAVLCIRFAGGCRVDAVLSRSSKPIARTWRGHMTVTINRDDEEDR